VLSGLSVILFADRVAPVQGADEIMILYNGVVLEQGPRAVLAVNPNSRFYALLRTGLEELLA
jgi:ABC-type multidrug transport system fused ATPase/permease subunit